MLVEHAVIPCIVYELDGKIMMCMPPVDKCKLPITQRRGLIKLIPKTETDLKNLKTWRPLSLLNCDYKIAAKSIANRIQATLPKLINNDQTGFIKGRFIGENIRLIDSIIKYTANKKYPWFDFAFRFRKSLRHARMAFY